MKRISVIITLLTFVMLELAARISPTPYPYVMVASGDEEVEISDSLFYELATSVVFPVNKHNIPKDSPFAKDLIENVLPLMNQRGMRLEKVIMRGAASPEGPLSWNTTLGELRLKAINKLISSHMDLPSCDDCQDKVEVPEDYKYLVRMMRAANDSDTHFVDSLVNQYYNTDIVILKKKLQTAQRGKLWDRMLHTYFPELRAARVILVFRKSPIAKKLTGSSVTGLTTAPDMALGPIIEKKEKVEEAPQPVVVPTLEKEARRELLSVKTNLLMDFAYMPAGYDRMCTMPNVAIEYYPLHGHFTYGASFDIPWHQDYDGHKYFQARNYQLETRYYFRSGDILKNPPGEGAAFRGWYLQAYGHVVKYGIMFSEHRGWVGEGVGAGLGFGYVLPLTKAGHWRLEFGAQVGWFGTKYDPFQYECPVDPTEHDNLYYYKWTLDADLFKKRQHLFNCFYPTRVGVTLTYDLLYRKNKKKGISFRNWEYK